jgi:hypothetical protein
MLEISLSSRGPWVMALLVLSACGEKKEEVVQEPPPPFAAKAWCEHVAAGPAGTAPNVLALSEAHALVRFFSTMAGGGADEALVASLSGTSVNWEAAVSTYAQELESACALEADPKPFPAARIVQMGAVAVIHPGTGELALPPSAEAVAIDLRGLPAAPGLEQALARAIAVASVQPIARLPAQVHFYKGMMDEWQSESGSVYSNNITRRTLEAFAPTGSRELPVALLTSSTLAPAAARFALDLRLAGRAWIFGEPITTSVAEARWLPVGGRGLVIRTEMLTDEQGPVPDIVAADRSLADSLETRLGELPGLGAPPAVDRSLQAARPMLSRRVSTNRSTPHEDSLGVARANLITMHGALRRFFPYFHVVGDRIDERLQETLLEVEQQPLTRARHLQLHQRFTEAIRDGHGLITAPDIAPSGYLPVMLENVGGGPVVRRSALLNIEPGDTIVSIGERPVSEWLTEEYSRVSAATPGWMFTRAARRLIELSARTVFGVRSPEGTLRFEEITPVSLDVMSDFGWAPSVREAGRLGDLGAPDLAYLNLTTEVMKDDRSFTQALADAQGARGLVVDMRGYPGGVNHYTVLQHLIPTVFKSPLFRTPTWRGPDLLDTTELQYTFEPITTPSFHGPIVLLVGPQAVSAAENFSMMLVGANRVRVVGRHTAGTNGNITRLRLRGGFWFYYTGMEVLYPDGSTFHGVGVVPEVEVAPSLEDLAAERDSELLKAIELLK